MFLISAIKKDINFELLELKVDGGAVANNLLMETQATISNIKIIRLKIIETTAYGAALASAVGAGTLSLEKISELWHKDAEFVRNDKNASFYEDKKMRWGSIIEKLYLS